MDKRYQLTFSPSTSIREEGSIRECDAVQKPSHHNRRSASLFVGSSTFGFPDAGCQWRRSSRNLKRQEQGLVRRFSSPILPTSYSSNFLADRTVQELGGANFDSDRVDGMIVFRRNHHSRERELVSRSVSLKLDDDGDLYESFCPSDLEIKELLGKGFYGEVFKVIHRKTGRPMVLKKLYRLDPKGEQDFVKEAAVMRQLHHPHVLRFLGVLYNDKKLHLVTEFVGGGTLRQLLDSSLDLTWIMRLSIAKDVASGMAYLHSKNIIHRDLNSGNILIREENFEAVVADFGLARVMARRRAGRRRRLTVVGDPYLMAPEMAKEEAYNECVDVFSYGITLCEIIGRCPSDPDIMPRRQDFGIDQQRFVSQFVDPACPRPFLDLAFKCASVNVDKRPPFSLIENWLIDLSDNLEKTEVSERISQEIEAFTCCNTEEKNALVDDTPAKLSAAKTTPLGQKRRRSTDMGYASGRSREESPRIEDCEMADLK